MAKTVLVTGSSTGLGRDIAIHLAEKGFRVYGTMRNLAKKDAVEKPAKDRNLDLKVIRLDITEKESIESAVDTIIKESGEIYGLVNNAGIGLRGYFEDLTEDEIRQVFESNVFGTMAVTRVVLPHMRAARKGRIIIISSVGGKFGTMGASAYVSTKFAQEGFGESLAQEVGPLGLKVILVEPAIIKTSRWGHNRGTAQGATNPDSPYTEWFKNMEQLSDKLVKTSPTSSMDVARTVHHALTTWRPRMRYMVGNRARLVTSLRRHIPGELFEKVYFGEAMRRVTGRWGRW